MEYVLNLMGFKLPGLRKIVSPAVGFVAHIHDHFIPNHRNNYHPHVLGHRALALFSIMLVTMKIFTLTLLAFGPVEAVFSSAITTENIISLTNQSRVQFGLESLTENSQLSKAAQAKANDMLAKGYFAHNTPDGKTPWDFIVAAGYSYLQAGENLAVNFIEAEDVEDAWMNSPGHKANILNKNFEEIGIGIAQGEYQGHNAIFVVQEFGTPAAQKVALTDTPTKVQTTEVPTPLTNKQIQEAQIKPVVAQSQIRGDVSKQPVETPVVEDLLVKSGKVDMNDNNLIIDAQVSGPAVKVLAYYGGQAVMLNPKSNGEWAGQVAASEVTQNNRSVKLVAFDIKGQSSSLKLAEFSGSSINNYHLGEKPEQTQISFMGITFNPQAFENRFYMIFISGLLTSLVLAIAIKKHVQHIALVANSSFVIMLATLLWWVK